MSRHPQRSNSKVLSSLRGTRGVLSKWSADRERDWEFSHHDPLARKAAAAWRTWASTLSKQQRSELDIETRQDKRRRISQEISAQRTRGAK